MPGIQLRPSVTYDVLVEKNDLSLEDFVKLMSYNPAKIFGLKDRGYIKENMCSDLVIWSRECFKVEIDEIYEATDYSPYEGMQLIGRTKITIY